MQTLRVRVFDLPFYEPGSYWLVRLLFRKGLAVTYLLAFLVAARQFRPLAGEDGLRPIEEYVEHESFRERPSLFYYYPDDRVVGLAAWGGVGLSVLALLGLTEWFGTPVSMLAWFLLWALYQSFVNAGGVFYGYGWESMLLETEFLAIFLGAGDVATPFVVVLLLRWVLFRDMFGAGLIKLRGDECWRDLTCLDYHYETQPIPNPISWYAHHLPAPIHRLGVLVNHAVELVIPLLYFAPQPVAAIAGLVTIGFQLWLMLTGNFSWLNSLTIVLAVATFEDSLLSVLPLDSPLVAATPLYLWGAVAVVSLVVLVLSYYPVRNMLSERQVMNTAYDPLHLVNTYGAFGSITRERYEIVLQGTSEEEIDEDTEWETYEFPGKPTDPERRPPQIAPYHLRLDWQLWFAAMSRSPVRSPWFPELARKLLAGDDGVRSLLRHDPFPENPPEHVRALRYRYRFTTPAERRETERWWSRELVGTYYGPVPGNDFGAGPPRRRRLSG